MRNADEYDETELAQSDTTGVTMDLDRALAALSNRVRLCVVLSYHEGMTHGEIAKHTNLPGGEASERRDAGKAEKDRRARREKAEAASGAVGAGEVGGGILPSNRHYRA